MASELKKDTIYIDVDDEITTIIEKLQNSGQRIVALVLPKRAAVLQSVVNMKLLKRTADNAKKHVVLITSESGLLPLAGAVGLHVAPSLQSKPAIPPAPQGYGNTSMIDAGEGFDDFDPDAAAAEPVGRLAGLPEAAVAPVVGAAAAGLAVSAANTSAATEPETIELDNEEIDPRQDASVPGAAAAATATRSKPKKDKKLLVPNFNRFRLLLVAGAALLILLIGGFLYANTALAHATITLKTNSTDIPTKASLTFDPTAKELDLTAGVVPAKIASKQQTGSQQVSTSGQKNNGTKASGSVTLSLNDCSTDQVVVPAGTGVSAAGQTFITQSAANLQSVKVGGTCRNSDFKSVSTQAVSVVAQTAGAAYNVAASKFAVAGFSTVSGQSSDPMTGGTDNIVKVVTQGDIDGAKNKIATSDSSSVKDDLTKKLQADNYFAVAASLHASDPTVTPSANVGDQADTVTVTQATTYTMYGVTTDAIKTIITSNVKKQIDTGKQQILKDGVAEAKYDITSPVSSGPLQVSLSATSLAGPDINSAVLAKQLAGKRSGDVQSVVKSIPGVSDATVSFSPFWISKVPGNPAKVKIVIEKSSGAPTTTNGAKQ